MLLAEANKDPFFYKNRLILDRIEGLLWKVGVAGLGASCPQISKADGSCGEVFLSWSNDGKDDYIEAAVTLAYFGSTRTNPDTATCLNERYAVSEAKVDQRTASTRDIISRNSEYYQSAVYCRF
jgi:hypothetical protein